VRLRQAELEPDADAVAAIAAAESGIIGHCNNDHVDALAAIAATPGDWRMASADVDGTDLVANERVLRVHWSAPVADASGVRSELVRKAGEARAQ
jgi:hypothetical protein